MIYSMTGYGKGIAENENFTIEVEAKSVNSRYLDVFIKLPPQLLNREYELRELIKSKLKRGKVSVFVQLKRHGKFDEIPDLDKEKLKNYISLIKEIKKTAKLTEKIKLEHILYRPDFYASSSEEFADEEFELIKKAIDKALKELLKMKKDEGQELAKDLVKRIKIIDDKVNEIEEKSGESVREYFEKIKEKMKSLIDNVTDYSDRLELELAILADKSEITEECVRLKSHTKFFLDSLKESDEPGRKLNFLCQEMNREANTISSKTVSTEITHSAVLIKEEIEKIREQIQNIE